MMAFFCFRSPLKLSHRHQVKNRWPRDFPGSPVAKTPRSQCRGPRFDPGTRSLMLQLKIPHTATETEDLAFHNWDPAQPSELKKPSPMVKSKLLSMVHPQVLQIDPPLHSYLTLCVLVASNPLCGCTLFLVSMLVRAFSLKGTSSPSDCILFPKRFLWPFTLPRWAKYL